MAALVGPDEGKYDPLGMLASPRTLEREFPGGFREECAGTWLASPAQRYVRMSALGSGLYRFGALCGRGKSLCGLGLVAAVSCWRTGERERGMSR